MAFQSTHAHWHKTRQHQNTVTVSYKMMGHQWCINGEFCKTSFFKGVYASYGVLDALWQEGCMKKCEKFTHFGIPKVVRLCGKTWPIGLHAPNLLPIFVLFLFCHLIWSKFSSRFVAFWTFILWNKVLHSYTEDSFVDNLKTRLWITLKDHLLTSYYEYWNSRRPNSEYSCKEKDHILYPNLIYRTPITFEVT